YHNTNGSGTSADCVSSTSFQGRLVGATNWVKINKKIGIIREFAGGANTQCIKAL
ncbi:glycoside hydrolase family 5 protein, partial [Patellaria atrata CBS 101060]